MASAALPAAEPGPVPGPVPMPGPIPIPASAPAPAPGSGPAVGSGGPGPGRAVGVGSGLLVVQPLRRKHCAGCRRGPLSMLVLEDAAPRCLDCADLGHLVFLPRGDTALTRRSREESGLSVVVVRFNRRKGRYEREGVLVEEAALARAEERCLADAEARRRRRARDARLRSAQDAHFAGLFAAEVLRLFPGCPADRARGIAAHASLRGSGRVGRSAAGRALSEAAVVFAVRASVRHVDTSYDRLLMSGVPRHEARRRIAADVETVIRAWGEDQDVRTAGNGTAA